MAEELIAMPGPKDRERSSSRLEEILVADGARERARRARDRLLGLLAALSIPLWLAASWPAHVPDGLRLLAATLWALAAGAVAVAVARVWWWDRVRAGRLEELGPLPVLRSARAGGGACAGPADEED